MGDPRAIARKLASDAVAAGKPLEWFEQLYAAAESDGACIPWADHATNPNLIELFGKTRHFLSGTRALNVGCGLGDDAEWLAAQGLDVTAFDISPSAIKACLRRFPASRVNYQVADLFDAPSEWQGTFDLVQESYTLQVHPPSLREEAIEKICSTVAPQGIIMFVARARDEADAPGAMPWPLTKQEARSFMKHGFEELFFQDYQDRETPPVRRFQGCFRRQSEV